MKVPEPVARASLNPGKNISKTIIPIRNNIGNNIADIASACASPFGSGLTMCLWLNLSRMNTSVERLELWPYLELKENPHNIHIDAPIIFSDPQVGQ